jgi:hypothetical protein
MGKERRWRFMTDEMSRAGDERFGWDYRLLRGRLQRRIGDGDLELEFANYIEDCEDVTPYLKNHLAVGSTGMCRRALRRF